MRCFKCDGLLAYPESIAARKCRLCREEDQTALVTAATALTVPCGICACGSPLGHPDSVSSGVCVDRRIHTADTIAARAAWDKAKATVTGVGPDSPTVVGATGGKQSHVPYRADLLPPHALLAVAGVLHHGADKYGENNWHLIPVKDHVNHALVHLLALSAGDASDAHLEHAACRILFALDQQLAGRPKGGVSNA